MTTCRTTSFGIRRTNRPWSLSAIDIAQAYLQAELVEDLYMMVPPLMPAFDSDGDRLVISTDRGKCHITMSGPSVVYVTVNVREIFAARFARGPWR